MKRPAAGANQRPRGASRVRVAIVSIDIALMYWALGFSVIPIAEGAKEPPWGFKWKAYQSERPTEDDLRKWFGDGNRCGLAVVLGEVSGGLVCRDFDNMAAYDRWATCYPRLAKGLPTVETGRPGRHVYCRADLSQIRAASPTGAGIIKLGDGELRGDGGYCLLPPSRHPTGVDYRWIVCLNGEIPFLDLYQTGFLGVVTERTERTEAIRGVLVGGNRSIQYDQRSLDDAIDQAIAETLPTGIGRRNDCVFKLARWLKAIPAVADADPRRLKPIVQRWHSKALPYISTKPFTETWIDFLHSWANVKFPKGTEPMAQIFEKALEAELPRVAEQFDDERLQLLVSLCRELQRASGDGPFYLSARTAGRHLKVDHMTAWRWLFLLQAEHILKAITVGDAKTQKATRFRYIAQEPKRG
jgi:Bifunctional DNA primase/polymerase, N-terminal